MMHPAHPDRPVAHDLGPTRDFVSQLVEREAAGLVAVHHDAG
jgi:hypothetical protein